MKKKLFIYLKVKITKRERDHAPITFQMTTTARARPGQSQEIGTSSMSSTWVAGSQTLGPPCAVFPRCQWGAGEEMGLPACKVVPLWDAGVAGGSYMF